MKRRDLSAFEQPARRKGPTPRAQQSMARITLSLPTPVAEALRDASTKRAVGYRAMILDAVDRAGRSVTELTEFPPGRTQVPLNLPGDDLLLVDRAAFRAGTNRSAFVTECLRSYLDLPGPR